MSELNQTEGLPKIRLAVSNCLLGVKCRYNGGHAQDDFLTDRLAKFVELIPFCPEDAAMGTPRESVRLCEVDQQIRVLGGRSGTDYTDGLVDYNRKMIDRLVKKQIDGALVKAKSPSCGLDRIKIYKPTGEWLGSEKGIGQGLFTQALQQKMPHIALEDEGRLFDPWLRENFVLQLFSLARWRTFISQPQSVKNFQVFHRRHKFLLLSKNEALYRQMGPIVAQTTSQNWEESTERYQDLFWRVLASKTQRSAMINVLDHLYGYVKSQVSDYQKNLYLESLEEFREGIIPLIALMKLLRHWVVEFKVDYLSDQWIFDPYPAELALRSEINAFKNLDKRG
ncbi:YbgA family protein [Thiomicrospira microaerophila]|uniref:YbgA family protein n=1 Tax=Thiomicrospira microaerophila TaxID=406020 RepID=UPI00200FEEF2|nr:DUF523 and DUF1722 domain-containing protein [Thiomicrospira microaerophila]